MDFYDTTLPARIDAPPEKPVDVADTEGGAVLALFYVGCFWVLLALEVWAWCQ